MPHSVYRGGGGRSRSRQADCEARCAARNEIGLRFGLRIGMRFGLRIEVRIGEEDPSAPYIYVGLAWRGYPGGCGHRHVKWPGQRILH